MADIILAEDDPTLRMALAIALESEGYSVRAAADGAQALAAYREKRPDAMVLDVMMPAKSGYDVCIEVRRGGDSVPIVFLTAKSSEEDVVAGLGLGADDFIAKPLRLKEFFARVAAVLARSSRSAAAPAADEGRIRVGKALVDCRRFAIAGPGGAEQPLTLRELGLLRMFAASPGEVLSRETLLEKVWGVEYRGTTRTLDQHVAQLRRKLAGCGVSIDAVRGAGYRMESGGAASGEP